MFVLESGLAAGLSAPFLVAGAVALAVPLFLTSSRRSQRATGMKRWRSLHKLTYGVAAALLAHVMLIGEISPGAVLITLGFIGRIPAVRRWLTARADQRQKTTAADSDRDTTIAVSPTPGIGPNRQHTLH